MTFISRRDLLKRAGMTAVVAGAEQARPLQVTHVRAELATGPVGAELAPPPEVAESLGAEQARPLQASVKREPSQTFTAAEADLMDAIVARLIPTDEHGPGATEAHAVRYIDRALAGALASSHAAYSSGLAALERYAQSSRGAPFARLSVTDQDSVLIDVETGAATGFTGSSAAFFAMVLSHTHQGTFGDPYYGGNATFVGWDLLAYPGVRTMVTAADQQALESGQLKSNHRSAYDYESFTKAAHDHDA